MAFRISTPFMIIALVACQLCTPRVAAVDEVGLYFDPDGVVNCLPTAADYPFTVDAYLILENCSAGRISTWEATLDLPAGIRLVACDPGPGAVNEGVLPELLIVLAEPLTVSSTVVLARLRFAVEGPGAIYLHAPESRVRQGVLAPVYRSTPDEDSPVAMNHAYGGPFHPVATIGLTQCPADTLETAAIEMGWPRDYVRADTSGARSRIAHGEFCGGEPLSPEQLADLYGVCDLVFQGRVVTAERVAMKRASGRSRHGLARAVFALDECYRGPDLDRVEIWFDFADVPGWMRHAMDERNVILATDLQPGDRYLVGASYYEGTLWSHKGFLERTTEEDPVQPRLVVRDLTWKVTHAEMVCVLGPRSANTYGQARLDVLAVLKGDKGLLGTGLDVSGVYGEGQISAAGDLRPSLCFLNARKGGGYVAAGFHDSVLFLSATGACNEHGLPVRLPLE